MAAQEPLIVVACLNRLIETCRDRELGYRTAAEAACNRELRSLLESYQQQSAAFAVELQAEVERLDGVPAETGSVGGWLTRGWQQLTTMIAGGEDGAVIGGCERGEDAACCAYQAALAEPLPPDVRSLLLRHFDALRAGHDRLLALQSVAVGPA